MLCEGDTRELCWLKTWDTTVYIGPYLVLPLYSRLDLNLTYVFVTHLYARYTSYT